MNLLAPWVWPIVVFSVVAYGPLAPLEMWIAWRDGKWPPSR